MKSEVNNMKSEVNNMKSEVNTIKLELSTLETNINKSIIKLESILNKFVKYTKENNNKC